MPVFPIFPTWREGGQSTEDYPFACQSGSLVRASTLDSEEKKGVRNINFRFVDCYDSMELMFATMKFQQ